MKKLGLFLFFLLFPSSVLAESVWLECPKDGKKNEEFTCTVKGYSSYEICALEYQFTLPPYLQKLDFQIDPIWQGGEYENKVVLYTEKNKVGDFDIGEITLKSSKKFNENDMKTTWLLFGDKDLQDHVIIDKRDENVNDLKSDKKNPYFYLICGMILIIGIFIIGIILKKVGK